MKVLMMMVVVTVGLESVAGEAKRNKEGETQGRIQRQAHREGGARRRGRKQGDGNQGSGPRPLPGGLPALPPGLPGGFRGNLPDLTKLPDLYFDCSSLESMTDDERKFCATFTKCLDRKANKAKRKGRKNKNSSSKRTKRQEEATDTISIKDRRICHTNAHLKVVTQAILKLPPTPPSPTN